MVEDILEAERQYLSRLLEAIYIINLSLREC